MKNLFVLVFLLFGAISFANANVSSESNVNSSLINVAINDSYGENLFYVELMAPQDCTVKARVKVTMSDGSTKTIDGYVTVVGVSCAELFKQLISR
jgi:hypothetical protein